MRFHRLVLVILVTASLFDIGMRLDQRALCHRTDQVQCPTHISVWAGLFTAF